MATDTDPNRLTQHDELEDLYQQSPSQEDVSAGINKAQDYANQRPAVDAPAANELRDLKKRDDFYQPGEGNVEGGSLMDKMRRRRRSIIGGGLAGALTIGGFGMFTFLQAPFKFIHLSQLLSGFHLDAVTDFGDNRGWNLIEYGRTVNNPNKRNVGYFGEKISARYMARLEAEGLQLDFKDPNSRDPDRERRNIQGFIIDTDTDAGQLLIQRMRAKGVDPGDFVDIGDNKVRISLRGTGGTLRTKQIIGGALETIDMNGIAGKVGRISLVHLSGADFHMFKNKVKEKGQDFFNFRRDVQKEEADRHRTGADLDTRTTRGTQEDPNNDGTIDTDTTNASNETNELIDEIGKATTPEAKAALTKRLLGGGAALALAGALCTVHDLGKGYEDYQHQNIDQVLARMGIGEVSKGQQIKSNIDTNVDEIGAHNELLYDPTAPVGERSVFSARSIQANLGQNPTGPEAPLSSRPSNSSQKPELFRFVSAIPGLPQACGLQEAAGEKVPLYGRFLDLTSRATEAAINTGLGIFGLSMSELVDALYDFFINGGVNVLARGGLRGALLDIGVRMASIFDFMGKAGRELSGTEEGEVKAYYARMDDARFEAQSLWTRLFSPYEPRSLYAKAILENPTMGNVRDSYTSMARIPFNVIPDVSNSIARLASPSAYAQSARYDYGFNLYGYSVSELELIASDESYENPYENATYLEANNFEGLREGNRKWGKCFGVNIDPDTGVYRIGQAVNRYKLPKECKNKSPEFLRYRLYYADKQMEYSYACYDGEESACDALGFGNRIVGAGPNTGGNGTCDPRTTTLGEVDGYESGTKTRIQVCAIPNLSSNGLESDPSSSYYIQGASGKAIVNASVSRSTFEMVEAAKAQGTILSGASTFRSNQHQQALYSDYQNGTGNEAARPGYSNHQMGLAIDFDISKCPTTIGGKCAAPGEPEWDWLNVNASRFGFSQYSGEAWHWSTTGN
jgi:hypothetical protein